MSKTNQALAMVLRGIPRSVPITIQLITSIAYLSDWKSSINLGHQITDFHWDLHETKLLANGLPAALNRLEEEKKTLETYEPRPIAGTGLKGLIRRSVEAPDAPKKTAPQGLTSEEIDIVKSVLALLEEPDLIERIVQATYPVNSGQLDEAPNLPSIANVYKRKALALRNAQRLAEENPLDRDCPTGAREYRTVRDALTAV